MFSTFDCAVKGYRQKEDPWNAILSGFLTGGCLAARGKFAHLQNEGERNGRLTFSLRILGGPKAAFGGAVGCAILLGVFEGIGVLMGRMFAQPIPQLPRTQRDRCPGSITIFVSSR